MSAIRESIVPPVEHVDEQQSRAVAEAAREQEWRKPSFAKGLYLGQFDLSLIHPHPRPQPERRERGEQFLADLEAYLRTVDGPRIEREARIPDEVFQGLAELGCFGMKIPVEYGGLGLGQYYYNHALTLIGSVNASIGALLSAHQSVGLPEPLVLAGTEEQKRRVPAALREGRDQRLPAHRAGGRLGSRPTAGHRDADRGRHRVRAGRHQAVDHERGRGRTARRDGARAEVRRTPRRDQRVHRRGRLPRHHRAPPQRLHGTCAESRTG